MNASGILFRRMIVLLPMRAAGFAAFVCIPFLCSSCSSLQNPDNAPAYGTIGGITAGALIGSVSGHAGTGAFIGGMLGQSGGEIFSSEQSPRRAENDAYLLQDLPSALRQASGFDNALAKEHASLARRRATSPGPETVIVQATASRKIPEIKSWIGRLEAGNDALSRAIRSETSYPTGRLREWLSLRSRVRERLNSLKMHLSWYQSLAS